MTDKLFENNQVTMMGEIVSAFQFSHEVFWRRFLHGGTGGEPSE